MDAALFVRQLRATGLLDDAAVQTSVRELRRQSGDARRLAAGLVRRKLLTPYQARRLLRGQGRRLVFGPYRYLERVGKTPYGRVYRALHVPLGRAVAVKILRGASRAAFEQQTLPAARLTHPNLVTVLDAFRRGGLIAIVTEWVEGCNLADLVEQSGPLPIAAACGIALQAAGALRHVHDRGLVHGALEPGNVLLADISGSLSHHEVAAPGLALKMLNLGLGWRAAARGPDGELLRPSEYLAPEQLAGEPADARSDLFALGRCLQLMITGRTPCHDGPPTEQLRPDVPPDLAAVLRRLTAPDPAGRFRDVGQAAEALLPFRERFSAPDLSGADVTVAELTGSETMPSLALRRGAETPEAEERAWDVMQHLVWAAVGGLAAAAAFHLVRFLW